MVQQGHHDPHTPHAWASTHTRERLGGSKPSVRGEPRSTTESAHRTMTLVDLTNHMMTCTFKGQPTITFQEDVEHLKRPG